jgi:peptidyl-prolyl cis-trans isomerase A (cyclophilin A)
MHKLALAAALSLSVLACSPKTETTEIIAPEVVAAPDNIPQLTQGMEKTASGLYYKITKKTTGKKAKSGETVSVDYTGKLTNGTTFDSSVGKAPIQFPVGVGQVIKGWDEGILLLNEGEEATFFIPSNLGYGERAMGPIPANANLIFDVKLVKVGG